MSSLLGRNAPTAAVTCRVTAAPSAVLALSAVGTIPKNEEDNRMAIMFAKLEDFLTPAGLEWGLSGTVRTKGGDFIRDERGWESVGVLVKLHLNVVRWLFEKEGWIWHREDEAMEPFSLFLPNFDVRAGRIVGIRDPKRAARAFTVATSWERAIDEGGQRYLLEVQYARYLEDYFAVLLTGYSVVPREYMPPPARPVGIPIRGYPPEWLKPPEIPPTVPLWQVLGFFHVEGQKRPSAETWPILRRDFRYIRVYDYPSVYSKREFVRRGTLRWYTNISWFLATDEFMRELFRTFKDDILTTGDPITGDPITDPIDVETWASGEHLQRCQRGIVEVPAPFTLLE